MPSGSKGKRAEIGEYLHSKAGRKLRPHQVEGVEFIRGCFDTGHGCVLADEMGLGKTCQTLALLSYMLEEDSSEEEVAFLIICPLSVIQQWADEPKKFDLKLNIVVYRGDKEERVELRREITKKNAKWNAILTTYELLIGDSDFFSKFRWSVVVVDEAHRLKNKNSVFYNTIAKKIEYNRILLLTGTPVQNNMNELYSLLSLCHPDEFPLKLIDRFIGRFSDIHNEKTMKKLHEVLNRYVLRRTKDIIGTELPTKSEVVLFHNLTNLQKELYKAILVKDYAVFEKGKGNKQRLANILIHLRKCVDHPYLFQGIEPEPFEEGEHVIEASGKLLILDTLLSFLKKNGHKVLLYSQMTRMLDIVQDYLSYRGYTYQRLDGSVRSEERFAAIHRFAAKESFCFLLSTKAGGLGLNLVAADTVIFLDSDFNPQNDLQAAARAHRMGQTRHVKVIRLVGRRTVEEIILARAARKLKFTDTVLAEKRDEFVTLLDTAEISEMLTFGLNEMGKEDKKPVEVNDTELEQMLGKSKDGEWVVQEGAVESKWIDEAAMKHIYTFEGKDYKEEAKLADREAFHALKGSSNRFVDSVGGSGKRRKSSAEVDLEQPGKTGLRSQAEMEETREKRRQAAERRKLAAEEKRIQREEKRRAELRRLWEENDYESSNLPEPDDEHESSASAADSDTPEENHVRDPVFIVGDVTKPQNRPEFQRAGSIIIHFVDDSGSWGSGGLFTALSHLSGDIGDRYEQAKKMEDLSLGDAHLIKVTDSEAGRNETYVALIVAHHHEKRHEVNLDAFEKGLKRVSVYASRNNYSVHMSRIGYGMKSFNWYRGERIIRKVLCGEGVPTYIYYYQKKAQKRRAKADEDTDEMENEESSSGNSDQDTKPKNGNENGAEETTSKRARLTSHHRSSNGEGDELPYLPSIFDGCKFYIDHSIASEDAHHWQRRIVAYGGQVASDPDEEDVTHVLVNDSSSKDDPSVGGSKKSVVTCEWLHECIKEKRLV